MLRRQSLIALGIAVVLGLLAVYLANIFLTTSEQRAASAPVGTTKVAVAAVPLDYGVDVTPEKVRFVDFPMASVPPGSFGTVAELLPAGKRRVALRPMQVNEPILASKISGEGQSASLAALLPDGKRAAAVRIDDVTGVAGFVQPNDAVDVLITRQARGTNRDERVTDVLLQNVRVIAIDQQAKDANGEPKLARTATLEVEPLDAQKLALGQQVGNLSLVLRKPGAEQDSPMIETVSLEDLRYNLYGSRYRSAAAPSAPRIVYRRVAQRPRPRPAPRVAAPSPPPTSTVEVVRGTTGSQYEVGDNAS